MPRSGTTILVKIENPSSPGTYRTVGSQRDAARDRTGTFIDTSSKDSYDQTGVGGLRSSTLTLDAMYVHDDAAFNDIENAYESDPPGTVKLHMSRDGTDRHEATAVITSLGERHPFNDASTVAITFQITGGWTAI